MSQRPFAVAPLDAALDRKGFQSGIEALDHYFHKQVMQDMRRRVTACFVASSPDAQLAGFYTLASSSVLLSELPQATARKLPRYPSLPVVRMGRLAVDMRLQGQGLGAALLADALSRCMHAEIAAYALVVDAKDGVAARVYQHHGFVALPSAPLCLFLPLATARSLG